MSPSQERNRGKFRKWAGVDAAERVIPPRPLMLNVGGSPASVPYADGVSDHDGEEPRDQLLGLRQRADEDFTAPPGLKVPGRHQADIAELGVRVAITRSRYPNRDDGVDQYAVTLTRSDMDVPVADAEARIVLETAFGEAASEAVERTAGGRLVRMFRVPAG